MHLPGLSVIEAPGSVLGGGLPLMSTPPCRCYASHRQSVRRNVNRNAGLICNHILSKRTMCFSRRVRLLLIVIAAGVSISADTQTDISYSPILQRNEHSPICSIGLTLMLILVLLFHEAWKAIDLSTAVKVCNPCTGAVYCSGCHDNQPSAVRFKPGSSHTAVR